MQYTYSAKIQWDYNKTPQALAMLLGMLPSEIARVMTEKEFDDLCDGLQKFGVSLVDVCQEQVTK